ncbi:MAG TPA: hypothetical protein VMT57_00425 [Candidatus Thermoplasmatota archaeon]|nr:hypothetical protein [Candidatus Thermoplasmatota archaeon]
MINNIGRPSQYIQTGITQIHSQIYVVDFFGDSVDAMVTIDSGTDHAPESAACLVLLFVDPKVGAVTEDITSN